MSKGEARGGSRVASFFKMALTLLIFCVGAIALALVMTGRMPSPEDLGLRLGLDATSGVEQGGSSTPEPAPEGLEAFSWADLSRISAEIAAAPSREEGIKIAASYGICTEDGQLIDTTKRVELSDGTKFGVRVAGILRDEHEGSLCGLSFVCTEAPALHAMNPEDVIDGGWEGSQMRSWLNSEFKDMLPQDLLVVLVPVQKKTNNVGPTYNTDDVSVTTDALWLLSAAEVVGEHHWFAEEYGSQYGYWDDVMNAEGTQYACFSQKGVNPISSNDALLRNYQQNPVAWFYRSAHNMTYDIADIDRKYFFGTLETGFPHAYHDPSEELGVVFGFCV